MIMTTLERVLLQLVVALGVLTLASYLALAFVHFNTLYDVNQTSGAWLSFTYYFDHGLLYPPLADHGYYAGTRYFPEFFALHALFSKITGEYLISGKLLTFLSTLVAIGALAAILARKTSRPLISLGLASIVLATYIGHKGSLTIRGDILPLALSLVALALIDRELTDRPLEDRPPGWRLGRALIAAAILAGLAPLAKFTSFHALTAGFLAMVQRDRRRAFSFAAVGAGVFFAGVFLTELASHGRFFENLAVAALAPAGHKRSFPDALGAYFQFVFMDKSFLVLLPFALLALVSLRRPIDLFRIYFVLQLIISAGFFLDTGAEYNHLIDLLVATVILAATLASRARTPLPLRIATLAAFVVSAILGLATNHRTAWTAPERGIDAAEFLRAELGLGDKRVLAHDPTVNVLLGQRPIVADDFQYRVMVMRDVVPKDELPARVRAHEFERIVLLNPAEPNREDPEYTDLELGPHVARAIRESYTLEKQVGRFYVYRPRPNAPPS